MISEITEIFIQYLLAVSACFIFFLLGKLLLKLFPFTLDNYSKWFSSYATLVAGIVTVIFIYSIIITKGRTVNILFISIIAGFFFVKRNKGLPDKKVAILKKSQLSFFIVAPLLFVLLFHLFPESEYKQADALHYLQISESLNTTGQENYFVGNVRLGNQYVGTTPYHYFEYWLNAILLQFFGQLLPGIQLLRFVCYGIISTAGLLGMFALAESILKAPLTLVQILLCFCFIFYLPNLFSYFHFLQPVFIYDFENNILERPNLRIFYMFLPGFLIAIENKKLRWQTLFWIVGAMISSFINFAVLISSVGLYCIATIKKPFKKSSSFQLLISVFVIAIFYFLFYHFTSNPFKITPDGIEKQSIIKYLLRYWKIIMFSSITSIFYCLFIPLLLIIFVRKYNKEVLIQIFKERQIGIMITCAVIVCAVVLARVLNFMDNAYQFAFLGYCCGSILLFIILFELTKRTTIKNWVYYFICFTFLMSFLIPRFFVHPNSYANVFRQNGSYVYGGKKFSAAYITGISTAFPANSKVNGAYWADSLFYDSVHYYSNRSPVVYTLPSGYVLAGKLKYNYEVCLSDSASIMYGIDTTQKIIYDYLRSAIVQSPFYQYRKSLNVNEQRLSIIKKYNLQYLILTKNADTSIINQLNIIKSFQDYNTGERFYVINNN